MTYRRWTEQDRERLIDLKRAGLTRRQIGKELDRTYKAIKWRTEALRAEGVL